MTVIVLTGPLNSKPTNKSYLCLTGLAEWSEPSGGMFLWLKLHVPDTYKLITVKAREKGVLFVPGNAFVLDSSQPCPYVRASYSMSSAEQMDKVYYTFSRNIRKCTFGHM